MNIVRRFLMITLIFFLLIGAWSAYRAWVQVRSVEVRLLTPNLREGASAIVRVVTSGRGLVTTRLELVQGNRAELIAQMLIAGNRNGFFDPRFREGIMTPSLTKEFLARFQPGAAILRATATGRPQWTRLPPPTVQELAVSVAP